MAVPPDWENGGQIDLLIPDVVMPEMTDGNVSRLARIPADSLYSDGDRSKDFARSG